MTSGQRKIALFPVLIYTTAAPLEPFGGGGLISAILRRQSASESCGPETNVPLTFVLYHPDTTPSLRASSVLTWRGERICIGYAFSWARDSAHGRVTVVLYERFVQPSSANR